MEATIGSGSRCFQSFGQEQFGAAEFGDRRLTARAVTTADALLARPAGSLPSKLSKAQLLGFYDFANNPKVCHEKLMIAHYQRTADQVRAVNGTVLLIHDTTEADYSGLCSVADLGPIGNGSSRGLLVHHVLAVDYEKKLALGLMGQVIHRRRTVPKKESAKAKRQHPQRESRLWIKGVEHVGPVPAGRRWVNLMDRGGDSFESLQRQRQLGQSFVCRSKSNRRIEVRDAAGRTLRRKLHPWARRLESLGQRQVKVSASAGQPARSAVVRVAAGAVRLLAPSHPHRGEFIDQPLDLWVVHVKEAQPPAGIEPLEWILLCDVPADTCERAFEVVDWYQCRPIVEELHKAEKTGCGMEQVQFTTAKALEVVIAMASVVAVQLLRLRDLSRDPATASLAATQIMDAQQVQMLSLWRYKELRDLSVKEFYYALAMLGGHLGRPSDRPPGWIVLWRGWMELQRLMHGAELQELKKSGQT